jgi:predicted transcriptional regulator
MSAVAEVQAAVARLPAADRVALFHWLEEKRHDLLAKIDAGLAEADRGELIEGEVVVERLKSRARGVA